MIRRSTWILLGVFILLLVAAFYWQRRQADEQAQVTPTAASFPVFDFSADDVRRLSIHDGGIVLTLVRQEDGWELEEPEHAPADPVEAESLVEQVSSLEAVSSLQPAPPAEATGLDAPASTVVVLTGDGRERTLEIGSLTPTGSGYYVRVDRENVYVVNQFRLDAVLEAPSNPPLAATPEIPDSPEAGATP